MECMKQIALDVECGKYAKLRRLTGNRRGDWLLQTSLGADKRKIIRRRGVASYIIRHDTTRQFCLTTLPTRLTGIT